MSTQKPTTTHLVQLPAGISAIFRSLLIASSSGHSGGQYRSPGPSSSGPAAGWSGRYRTEHGDKRADGELRDLIDAADQASAGRA